MIHGNDKRLKDAPTIDARSLLVEFPMHKGMTLRVTDLRIAERYGAPNGTGAKSRLILEALCPYCEKYHYVKVEPGAIAGLGVLPWHE